MPLKRTNTAYLHRKIYGMPVVDARCRAEPRTVMMLETWLKTPLEVCELRNVLLGGLSFDVGNPSPDHQKSHLSAAILHFPLDRQ